MKQNQYNYTRKVGRITYSIVVREAEEAKEKVDNRIKKLLLNDLSKAGYEEHNENENGERFDNCTLS